MSPDVMRDSLHLMLLPVQCLQGGTRLATGVRHVRRVRRSRILLSRTWSRLVPTEFQMCQERILLSGTPVLG